MSIKKLVSQTATYGITTIVVRFINYFLTPYFTNLAIFTPSVYGVMNYYYALIPFGLTLLCMGLESGYFRFYGKCESEEQRDKLFSTLTTTIALLSTIFFTLALILKGQIYDLLGGEKAGDIAIIPIVAAIIGVDAITSMPFAKLRAEGKTLTFMKAKIISVLANLVLCVFFYSILPFLSSRGIFTSLWNWDFGSGYVFIANLTASIITILFIGSTLKGFRFAIDKKLLKTLFVFSIPLFASGFTGTANEFIDRQLLYFLLPSESATAQLGLYSAAMKIAAFIYLFTQMYRYAAEPFFLSEVKQSEFKETNGAALKYFTIASLAIFLFITLFIDYFQYFVGQEFREGIKIVPILLFSNLLAGVYLNLSYWYKVSEKTRFAVIIALIGIFITILLNLFLIPKMGYTGSAWARLGSELGMVIISYFLGQRYMKIDYKLGEIAKYLLLAAAIFILFRNIEFGSQIIKSCVALLFFIIFVGYFTYQEKLISRLRKKWNF